MCINISRQQFGIILTIIGTIFLAFSVKMKRQYIEDMAKRVDDIKKKNPNLIEPTETYIVQWLFWLGLFFIAVGSMLQW